ncbi:MAG: lysyl oxidase family protein [Thermoleophilaceae bacterium]
MAFRSALAALTVSLVTLTMVGLGHTPGANGSTATELLPDLDQQTPNQLLLARDGGQWLLGFQSAVRNIGTGPLLINGHRANRKTPFMVADQVINRTGAPPVVDRGVGRLRYVRSPDHQHWHLLRFERYELRRAGSSRVVVRDRKTGFCLGDRYRVVARKIPAAVAQPVHTGRCALRRPGRLRVSEGISVGWGDNYVAYLEGQSLPVDGLRDGRYVLVHRVNTGRGLRELNYSNDASSVLLDLRWHGRSPRLRLLASCPDSDACDAPPAAPSTAVPRGHISATWRRSGLIASVSAICSLGVVPGRE